jgi:hypothetical protein
VASEPPIDPSFADPSIPTEASSSDVEADALDDCVELDALAESDVTEADIRVDDGIPIELSSTLVLVEDDPPTEVDIELAFDVELDVEADVEEPSSGPASSSVRFCKSKRTEHAEVASAADASAARDSRAR